MLPRSLRNVMTNFLLIKHAPLHYDHDFGRKVGQQAKSLASNICCLPCVRLLIGSVNGSRQMPFAVPMV